MKEYIAENLIQDSRFAKLYNSSDTAFQHTVTQALTKYIDECSYKDEKNYGHLCNLLGCMAVYEALLQSGKSTEECLDVIRHQMYSFVEPARLANIEAAKKEHYIEDLKIEHKKQMEETYGIGWELEFPDCGEHEFTYLVKTCIYHETFKRYHYPELGPLFCKVDDILNGDLEKIDFSYTGQLCVNQRPCDYTFRYKDQTEEKL